MKERGEGGGGREERGREEGERKKEVYIRRRKGKNK